MKATKADRNKLMSMTELAEIYGRSVSSMRRWCAEGLAHKKMPASRGGLERNFSTIAACEKHLRIRKHAQRNSGGKRVADSEKIQELNRAAIHGESPRQIGHYWPDEANHRVVRLAQPRGPRHD